MGHATRCESEAGIPIVGIGAPRASTLRIVDRETRIEQPAGEIGEVWLHGENVADGYWRNPEASKHTFGGQLVDPSAGTPTGPWLRTGDLGVISEGELFIVGRIKDLLIVDGRNHYPDDIEATIQRSPAAVPQRYRCPRTEVSASWRSLKSAERVIPRRRPSTNSAV